MIQSRGLRRWWGYALMFVGLCVGRQNEAHASGWTEETLLAYAAIGTAAPADLFLLGYDWLHYDSEHAPARWAAWLEVGVTVPQVVALGIYSDLDPRKESVYVPMGEVAGLLGHGLVTLLADPANESAPHWAELVHNTVPLTMAIAGLAVAAGSGPDVKTSWPRTAAGAAVFIHLPFVLYHLAGLQREDPYGMSRLGDGAGKRRLAAAPVWFSDDDLHAPGLALFGRF